MVGDLEAAQISEEIATVWANHRTSGEEGAAHMHRFRIVVVRITAGKNPNTTTMEEEEIIRWAEPLICKAAAARKEAEDKAEDKDKDRIAAVV